MQQGYDSVKIIRGDESEVEYVVYNYDQVDILKMEEAGINERLILNVSLYILITIFFMCLNMYIELNLTYPFSEMHFVFC